MVVHVADGALSAPVMVGTNVLATMAVGVGLRRIDHDRIPRVGVLSAFFFLASFIHVNIGPSSVHLLLNGLLGLLLGWGAFPALAVALFLQAVLLGFGGITSLGANVLGMGLPAVVVWLLFAGRCGHAPTARAAMIWASLAGATSVLLTCTVLAVLLHISDPQAYDTAAKALVVAHLPVMFIEAAVMGAAGAFLHKVRPDLLQSPLQESKGTDCQ